MSIGKHLQAASSHSSRIRNMRRLTPYFPKYCESCFPIGDGAEIHFSTLVRVKHEKTGLWWTVHVVSSYFHNHNSKDGMYDAQSAAISRLMRDAHVAAMLHVPMGGIDQIDSIQMSEEDRIRIEVDNGRI